MTEETAVPAGTSPQHLAGRPRRARVVGALLGLGVLAGAGVSGTSAAWTDGAWFATTASSGSVDLRGSADGVTYLPADDGATAVVLEPVTGLTPDTGAATRTLHLRNDSSVPLTLDWATDAASLGGDCLEVTLEPDLTGRVLAPGAVTTATVTFAVPAGADGEECSGATLTDTTVVVQGRTS